MAILKVNVLDSVDVSDLFYFSARGGGRGSPRHREGGGSVFLLKNARRGVSRKGSGRGAGRVSAANCGIGGGLNFFFFGAEMSTE